MRLLFPARLFAFSFGIATSSHTSFLTRTDSQQLGVGPAFFQEEKYQAASDSSLVGGPACDAIFSDSICFSDKRQPLLPSAVPGGLVAHYDFDADTPIDSSGNGNHAMTELYHGPSPAGSGHSGLFHKSFMMVPDSPMFKTKDFTYSFWIYIVADDEPVHSQNWCPLIRKGINLPATQQFANAPALLFSHGTGQLRAEMTTTWKGIEDGENVGSNARLLPDRWMHIAMVHHSAHASLLLYVNGILDNAMTTQGDMVQNDYPLYVGGDPFTQDQCGFTAYMDELRIYSHAVPPHQLQAEAAPALGGTDPNYVHLGCLSCNLLEAAKRCPKDRHICTSIELHTGGYQVARSLGWLRSHTHVWTHAAVVQGAAAHLQGTADANTVMGLGLCCEGPP